MPTDSITAAALANKLTPSMPESKKAENFIEVRCVACHKILFEADEATIGTVRKKCDRCKILRTIRLPLHSSAKKYTIPFDAARAS